MTTQKLAHATRALIVAASLGAATLGVAACNTTEGLGKDVESTGDAIKDTARDVKD